MAATNPTIPLYRKTKYENRLKPFLQWNNFRWMYISYIAEAYYLDGVVHMLGGLPTCTIVAWNNFA